MAPSRLSNGDGDTDASSGGDVSMNDVPGPVARLKRDNAAFIMRVSPPFLPVCASYSLVSASELQRRVQSIERSKANMYNLQDAIDTPDYTVLRSSSPLLFSSDTDMQDSDTNPNTTASSVAGDLHHTDGRKRRSEAFQLRKSVFGKKHSRLNEEKVCTVTSNTQPLCNPLTLAQ